jgi:uncharacterized damage-inducible protein DinB
MDNQFHKEFVKHALYRMDENLRMIGICMNQLTEEEIWMKPNDSTNSIGNLLLHLCGNITQYAISSLDHRPDHRKRDKEFSSRHEGDKAQLLARLEQVVKEAQKVLKQSDEKNLINTRQVQAYTFSGIGNVMHVIEHFSYHTGQIALWTKLLQNKDLGFYDGVDLNNKNKD